MARGLNGSANGSSQWHGNERGVEARKPGDESSLPPEVVDVLPAVVGVHDATRRLTDGQRVRLDGASGSIELVER